MACQNTTGILFNGHTNAADPAAALSNPHAATADDDTTASSPLSAAPVEIAALSTLRNVTTGKRSSSATELNEAKVIAFLANEPQITDPQFNYPPREWK